MATTFTTAAVALQASATNTAAGTTTGSWIDITASGGGLASLLVTNGGTGPTIACSGSIDASPDNGTTVYNDLGTFTAGVTASTTYYGHVIVPPGTRYIRSRFTGNTVQGVTVQADFQKLTGTS